MKTKVTAYHLNEEYEANAEVESAHGIYTVKLNIGDQEAIGKGVTIFEALLQIRLIIEPAGWLLGVNASRIDANHVINTNGNYGDKVTIVTGNTTQNLPALDHAPKESIANIALQRSNFDKIYNDLIIHEKLIRDKEQTVKEIKSSKVSRQDTAGPSGIMTAIIVFISVAYPFSVYQLLFNPTSIDSGFASETYNTNSTSVVELLTWLLFAGICLYGIAIAVAVEYVAKGKGSGVFVFAAVSLPIISTIFSTYFAMAEISRIFSQTMMS